MTRLQKGLGSKGRLVQSGREYDDYLVSMTAVKKTNLDREPILARMSAARRCHSS